MVTDRRSFIVSGSAFSVAAFLPAGFAEETSSTEAAKPPEGEVARNRGPLPKDLVFAFVRAGHRDLPRVKEMLQSVPALLNASWDWGGGDWETALGGASHVGNHEIARYLLERGANIDAFCAAMLGEYQLLASLLTANPSAATASGPHRLTLLYHVAISGNVAIASLLKPLLAPRARDYDQALSAAGRGGHLEMTRWLLANGVTDPNQPDGVGKTALAHAVEKGFKQVADELRRYGAQ